MKRFTLALSLVALLGLAACANGGSWAPMSDGRTAGEGTVDKSAPANSKADKTFNKAMHKESLFRAPLGSRKTKTAPETPARFFVVSLEIPDACTRRRQ